MKPIQLRIEDTKKQIIESINDIANNNEMSYYFLENIIDGIHKELLYQKDKELQSLEEKYQQEINNGEEEE